MGYTFGGAIGDHLYMIFREDAGNTYLSCTTTTGTDCGMWMIENGYNLNPGLQQMQNFDATHFGFTTTNGAWCITESAGVAIGCNGSPVDSGSHISGAFSNAKVLPMVHNGIVDGYCYGDIGNRARECRDLNNDIVPLGLYPYVSGYANNTMIVPGTSRVISGVSDTDWACYDYGTQTDCGSMPMRSSEYGGQFISSKCISTVMDSQPSTFAIWEYTTDPSTGNYSIEWINNPDNEEPKPASTCNEPGGSISTATVYTRDPSLDYCSPVERSISWTQIDLSGIDPTDYEKLYIQVQDMSGNTLLDTYIDSNSPTYTLDISGINYSTYPNLTILVSGEA
jgi:hypothetical protein